MRFTISYIKSILRYHLDHDFLAAQTGNGAEQGKFLTMQERLLKNLGFTLIELMLTLAIAAVVVGIAVPSFSTAIKNNRITAQLNTFVTSLNIARSEAVKRGVNVSLCKSSDGTTCMGTGNWDQGWFVFVDSTNTGVHDAGEDVLNIQGATLDQITIIGLAVTIARRVTYSPSGGANTGTITVCDDRTGEAVGKNIVISSVGRSRVVEGIVCP